jgi:hypothetical protein
MPRGTAPDPSGGEDAEDARALGRGVAGTSPFNPSQPNRRRFTYHHFPALHFTPHPPQPFRLALTQEWRAASAAWAWGHGLTPDPHATRWLMTL